MDNREVLFAQLSACLALVRPVGMTEGDTMDWLAVAADALSHLPIGILEAGCRKARMRCTHHAQIVPAIVEETRDALEWHNRPKVVPLPQLPPPPSLTGEKLPDPNTLMSSLQRIGLGHGWLVEGADGLAWAEDQEGFQQRGQAS